MSRHRIKPRFWIQLGVFAGVTLFVLFKARYSPSSILYSVLFAAGYGSLIYKSIKLAKLLKSGQTTRVTLSQVTLSGSKLFVEANGSKTFLVAEKNQTPAALL